MDATLAEAQPMPFFRSPERARRWCTLRTIRDQQLAERRGRPISGPNARRLWMRRWTFISERPVSTLHDCYAHSLAGFPREQWQRLVSHLESVARIAAEFAEQFQSAEWAAAAGRLHDLGKAHPGFQAYLSAQNGLDTSEYDQEGSTEHVNHSGAGAILGMEKWQRTLSLVGTTLAYLIAGHHAGLPDWHGGAASLGYRQQAEKSVADVVRPRTAQWLAGLPPALRPPDFAVQCRNGDAVAYHLWVRMLFSCLVDADFLDTEAFMDADRHARRPVFPSLAELKTRFDDSLSDMLKRIQTPDAPVNRIRGDILASCRRAAQLQPGFFSLTVPTGGGKTLSGTAFGLEHAVCHRKQRIIYVIPYTSIIEQTADVLRRHFGAENVVEHHSNLAPEKDTPRVVLASENWDAPIIVTTNVQFFESLYAAKSSRCRKLHNIVNSVVILDEAQLLPPEWLYPCVEILNRLVSDYGVSVVLSTATQPVLPHLHPSPREIIPYPDRLYAQLQRAEIRFPLDLAQKRDWPSLAAELEQHRQVLCIVNRRRDCRELWQLMPKGTLHLSALMCGEHRSRTIAEIKAKLGAGESVRVISTQLVEAGVDIDFPVVYRALAGLDSINQAAGRCNREGTLAAPGQLHVFVPPEPAPPGLLRKGEDATRELALLPEFIPHAPEVFRQYFEQFYGRINDTGKDWWRNHLVKDVRDGHMQFRTAGQTFRLIDDSSVAVLVLYGDSPDFVDRLRSSGPNRDIMRPLQRYSVNVHRRTAGRLLDLGLLEEVWPGVFAHTVSNLYDSVVGLDIYSEGIPPEDLVI